MFTPSVSLSFPHAETALAEGLRAIENGETAFDLSANHEIDSTAVAVLLAWQRAAQKKGVQLAWHRPSPALHSLAELYGVHGLLHLKPEAAQ